MKISLYLCSIAVLSFPAIVSGLESCACVAEELGYKIDCSNQDFMTAAVAALEENNCATDCSTDICYKNFMIGVSHHDYCFEDEIPESVEDAVHIYEAFCQQCEVPTKYNPDLPLCPTSDCTEEAGNAAFQAVTNASCIDDCSPDACAENFPILKVMHDLCPEDTLSTEAELIFHDIDGVCEMHSCNVGDKSSDDNALKCVKPLDPSAAFRAKSMSAVAGLLWMIL